MAQVPCPKVAADREISVCHFVTLGHIWIPEEKTSGTYQV